MWYLYYIWYWYHMYYIHVAMFLNRLRSLFSLLKPTVQSLSSPLYSPYQLLIWSYYGFIRYLILHTKSCITITMTTSYMSTKIINWYGKGRRDLRIKINCETRKVNWKGEKQYKNVSVIPPFCDLLPVVFVGIGRSVIAEYSNNTNNITCNIITYCIPGSGNDILILACCLTYS